MNEKATVVMLLRRIFHGGELRRLPKKLEEGQIILALSLCGLDAQGIYDESEINLHLSSWLDGIASESGLDYMTLRRYLVDFGFLRRAADGVVYLVQADQIAEVLTADAQAVDPKEIFAEVQIARSQRRQTFSQ